MESNGDLKLRIRGRTKLGKPLTVYDLVVEDMETGKVLPVLDVSLNATVIGTTRVGNELFTATVTFFPEEIEII